jgi:hypothetical protein
LYKGTAIAVHISHTCTDLLPVARAKQATYASLFFSDTGLVVVLEELLAPARAPRTALVVFAAALSSSSSSSSSPALEAELGSSSSSVVIAIVGVESLVS